MRATDMSAGFLAAMNYDFNEAWTLAAKYQSRVKLSLSGDADFSSDAHWNDCDVRGEIVLPSSINMGLTNRSFENWILGFEVVWTEWSTYDSLRFEFSDSSVFLHDYKIQKDWNDVFSVRLGAERQLNENWCLRFGYLWDEAPVPAETRGPENPDADRHTLCAGLGYKREHWGVDFAYSYIFVGQADAGDTTIAPRSELDATGEYITNIQIFSFSIYYQF